VGEIAGIATALIWAVSSIFHTLAGRRVGAPVLNRLRLVFAVIWISGMHWLLQGQPFPLNAAPERWLWLGLSGIVGLVLGDLFLFQGFVLIGPRLTTLIMSGAPMLGVVLAWLLLGEELRPGQIFGIALTLVGIGIVVLERSANTYGGATSKRNYVLGLLAAFGGAVGQAGGLTLSKLGLAGDFPSISGVSIRMIVAMISLWLVSIVMGKAGETLRATKDRRALGMIVIGSILGPFIGVWLSLVSVQLSPVGVASTLQSLNPIFLLPIGYWVFQEKISPRAVIGTLVSLVGVGALFLL